MDFLVAVRKRRRWIRILLRERRAGSANSLETISVALLIISPHSRLQ